MVESDKLLSPSDFQRKEMGKAGSVKGGIDFLRNFLIALATGNIFGAVKFMVEETLKSVSENPEEKTELKNIDPAQIEDLIRELNSLVVALGGLKNECEKSKNSE